MIDRIIDKYLTWRTGLNKQDRDWYKWQGGTEFVFREQKHANWFRLKWL